MHRTLSATTAIFRKAMERPTATLALTDGGVLTGLGTLRGGQASSTPVALTGIVAFSYHQYRHVDSHPDE